MNAQSRYAVRVGAHHWLGRMRTDGPLQAVNASFRYEYDTLFDAKEVRDLFVMLVRPDCEVRVVEVTA